MPSTVEQRRAALQAAHPNWVTSTRGRPVGEVGWRMAGAWLVLAPGASAPSEDETVEWCRARLARFELARHVLSISADELPATATGKVQRFRLVELAQERLR